MFAQGISLAALIGVSLALSACASTKKVDEKPFSTSFIAMPLDPATPAQPAAAADIAAAPSGAAVQPQANQVAQAGARVDTSSPQTTGSVRTQRDINRGSGQSYSLEDAVFSAVTSNPRIGVASARARQAGANVDIARAHDKPQVDAQIGTGFDGTVKYTNDHFREYDSRISTKNPVIGAKVTLRKLIYDFGATRANIERAEKLYAAELFRRFDQAEDLAVKTIDAYLRVHEQRQLLALTRQNLKALGEIAALVKANEAGGNATAADVSRVETTLSDARKAETDQEAALETALDSFRRLTGLEMGDMVQPRSPRGFIPADMRAAERMIEEKNPELLALKIMGEAIDAEIVSVEAGNMPKLELEIEGSSDWYTGGEQRHDNAFKAMVYMRKNLYDGGTRAAQIDQLHAKAEETDMRYYDARDELIFDLRRQYRAVEAARDKQADLTSAVNSASEVQRLYREQFKAGKRTLFELLDSQMAYYSARQDQISNLHESLRAEYDILRTTGTLLTSMFPQ